MLHPDCARAPHSDIAAPFDSARTGAQAPVLRPCRAGQNRTAAARTRIVHTTTMLRPVAPLSIDSRTAFTQCFVLHLCPGEDSVTLAKHIVRAPRSNLLSVATPTARSAPLRSAGFARAFFRLPQRTKDNGPAVRRTAGRCLWCPGEDSNLHAGKAYAPEAHVSTNFTTRASVVHYTTHTYVCIKSPIAHHSISLQPSDSMPLSYMIVAMLGQIATRAAYHI